MRVTGWSLAYAPHLGFPGPDRHWFGAIKREHVHSVPGIAREALSLERLRAMDLA